MPGEASLDGRTCPVSYFRHDMGMASPLSVGAAPLGSWVWWGGPSSTGDLGVRSSQLLLPKAPNPPERCSYPPN